jgi:hypothetical protein
MMAEKIEFCGIEVLYRRFQEVSEKNVLFSLASLCKNMLQISGDEINILKILPEWNKQGVNWLKHDDGSYWVNWEIVIYIIFQSNNEEGAKCREMISRNSCPEISHNNNIISTLAKVHDEFTPTQKKDIPIPESDMGNDSLQLKGLLSPRSHKILNEPRRLESKRSRTIKRSLYASANHVMNNKDSSPSPEERKERRTSTTSRNSRTSRSSSPKDSSSLSESNKEDNKIGTDHLHPKDIWRSTRISTSSDPPVVSGGKYNGLFSPRSHSSSPTKLRLSKNSKGGGKKNLKSRKEHKRSSTKDLELVEALWDFEKKTDKEISLKQGDVAFVINRLNSQWWLLQNKSGEYGYAAVDYLKEVETEKHFLTPIPPGFPMLLESEHSNKNKQLRKYRANLWQKSLEAYNKKKAEGDDEGTEKIIEDLKKQLQVTDLPQPPPLPPCDPNLPLPNSRERLSKSEFIVNDDKAETRTIRFENDYLDKKTVSDFTFVKMKKPITVPPIPSLLENKSKSFDHSQPKSARKLPQKKSEEIIISNSDVIEIIIPDSTMNFEDPDNTLPLRSPRTLSEPYMKEKDKKLRKKSPQISPRLRRKTKEKSRKIKDLTGSNKSEFNQSVQFKTPIQSPRVLALEDYF